MYKQKRILPGRRLTGAIAIVLCGLTVMPSALGAQRVMLTGVQAEFGDEINESAFNPFGGPQPYTVSDLCAASPMIGMALQQMLAAFDSALAEAGAPITLYQIESMPGAPNRYDIERDLANARDAICDNPQAPPTVQPFTLTYSSCDMIMTTPANAMSIYMNDSGSAFMLLVDHTERSSIGGELTSPIDQVAQVVGSGWSDAINMNSSNQTTQIFGYDVEHYTFDYTSGLGEAGVGELPAGSFPGGAMTTPHSFYNMFSVTTEGEAWMSRTAPGTDIVQSFYRNLASRFQPGQATSFFGGMIEQLVGMLEYGMPIVIEQTTTSKLLGEGAVGGRSESHIANIRLREDPGESCRGLQAPADYEYTDINEEISVAMGGQDGASQAQMQEAMRQASEAMAEMPESDRQQMQQMMQNLGLGAMMPGGGGGTTPAPAQGARSSMPASADLRSGDLTTSVQQHLQALGYDVGNADGSLSLETQIAVSTFQAEQGLEVTGDVTPQLLGILSAEVDRRRGN